MLYLFKELFTKDELLKGNFGVEREALRVNRKGVLSSKCHPSVFGNKVENPYVTVDFAESQIEMITPALKTPKETHDFLDKIYDYVVSNIESEYLWPQSMPSIIPDSTIRIADFDDSSQGIEAREYREGLVKKYGAKKQLISGIHYNFSFNEKVLLKLFEKSEEKDFRLFKDNFYLKLARNYLRYRWLVIYLLGSSPVVHKTYEESCIKELSKIGDEDFSNEGSISYRNSEFGYQNLISIYPDYYSLKGHVESLQRYIDNGDLCSHKELYSQIRLKAKNNNDFFTSLLNDGINYLEVRNIDINPFEKQGIALSDLEFLHLFFIFLSIKEETNYSSWQEDAFYNQIQIAKYGLLDIDLKKDGKTISKLDFAREIFLELENINNTLELGKGDLINSMKDKIEDKTLTYAYKMKNEIKRVGYVNFNLNLSKEYKSKAKSKHSVKEAFFI